MVDLVTVKKGGVLVNSLVIAEKFKKPHKRVLESIEKLSKNIKESTDRKTAMLIDSYVIKKSSHQVNNRSFPCYELNRKAFSLVAMGFTGKKALVWKMQFLEAFELMEKALLNQSSLEWKQQREQGKLARKGETDTIKKFVELAESQGSKGAKWYYKHFTNATYKALQLIEHKTPRLRETLDMMELNQLILAENIAMKSIESNMEAGEHYKVIFVNVKNDIEKFASTLFLNYQKQIEA